MQDGQLTEQGTHDQLQQVPGFYQQLWAIQSGQQAQFEADAKSMARHHPNAPVG